jgi:hypothetical protein
VPRLSTAPQSAALFVRHLQISFNSSSEIRKWITSSQIFHVAMADETAHDMVLSPIFLSRHPSGASNQSLLYAVA